MARASLPLQDHQRALAGSPAFADSVEHFPEREGASIENYMDDLERRSPFKPLQIDESSPTPQAA